jgi:choline dehydrogenase-like flavoprotein
MPSVPSGHLNAVVMMMAEKAADLIKYEASQRPPADLVPAT